MEGIQLIILICVIVVVVFSAFMAILSRYRKCPSDKVLVIYGKVGTDANGVTKSARCIHGGAAFIVPVIQSYQYLDLTPMSINVDLKSALSKQNIRVDVPSRFTVGISTEPGIMQNAAERLLGLKLMEIQELAKDIIFGQLRLVIATMDIEEINTDRDKFLVAVSNNVEIELKKIGLRLINVNVTDINDESGYIDALGKEAAAKAINDAKKSVAEKDRDGAIGQANAYRDQRIQVAAANATAIEGENAAKIEIAQSEAIRKQKEAEAEARSQNDAKKLIAETQRDGEIGQANAHKDQRIQVAAANASAIEGENNAKISVAQSEAVRREKEAEALKQAIAAEAIQTAKAKQDAYQAQQEAELARAELEMASQKADIIVKTQIKKEQAVIEAETEAEVIRRKAEAEADVIRKKAQGEADASFAMMMAEAKGAKEILEKQAEGMKALVEASGGDADSAVKLIVADKLESLMQIQVDAIKNIKIDKVTVWDGGANGEDGKTATAGFLSGIMKSVPPLNELFRQSGMELPSLLGTNADSDIKTDDETVSNIKI